MCTGRLFAVSHTDLTAMPQMADIAVVEAAASEEDVGTSVEAEEGIAGVASAEAEEAMTETGTVADL